MFACHERLAQKVLAREVVSLVHGKAAYEQAVKTSEILFGGGDLRQLDAKSILTGLKAAPQHQVTDDEDLTFLGQTLMTSCFKLFFNFSNLF